jgi:hypothetical protein
VKLALVVTALLTASACSGDNDAPRKRDQPAVALVPGDGGVSQAITVPSGVDPSAVHLDDYSGTARPLAPQPLPGRERRAIDVTLRSTPPGAVAAVDGTPVGTTPAFWSGYADGREHQFVFTLSGHAIARYRFVPVSSGVIHARLERIADEPDAGVAPPPEVVPQAPPSAVAPPAPPPTIVTPAPDAAAPLMPPPSTQPTPPTQPTPTPTPTPPAPSGTDPVGPQP